MVGERENGRYVQIATVFSMVGRREKEDMFTLVVLDSKQRRPKMTVNESD